MVCNKCGAQLPEGTVYCSKCGAKVTTEQSDNIQSVTEQKVPVQQMIQPQTKSKLAVGIIAGLMFFLGMISNYYFESILTYVPIAVLGIYVIKKEEDQWLRKCAVRALGTVVMFAVLMALVEVFFNFIGIIKIFSSWGNGSGSVFMKFDDIKTILMYIIAGIQTILLFVMGIQAVSMKTTKVPVVDGLIDKYMR